MAPACGALVIGFISVWLCQKNCCLFKSPLSTVNGNPTSLSNHTIKFVQMEAFADNLSVSQKLKSSFERAENIVERGENACYQHFLLFSQC